MSLDLNIPNFSCEREPRSSKSGSKFHSWANQTPGDWNPDLHVVVWTDPLAEAGGSML